MGMIASFASVILWFPDVEIPIGFDQVRTAKLLPVLTTVLGYSRWVSALLISSRSAQDLFAGRWRLVGGLGAVPRLLVWDREGGIAVAGRSRPWIVRAPWRARHQGGGLQARGPRS